MPRRMDRGYYLTYPMDIVREVLMRVPSVQTLVKWRLVNWQFKDLVDSILTRPVNVLNILGSLYNPDTPDFMRYYLATSQFKALKAKPFYSLDALERLCVLYGLQFPKTWSDFRYTVIEPHHWYGLNLFDMMNQLNPGITEDMFLLFRPERWTVQIIRDLSDPAKELDDRFMHTIFDKALDEQEKQAVPLDFRLFIVCCAIHAHLDTRIHWAIDEDELILFQRIVDNWPIWNTLPATTYQSMMPVVRGLRRTLTLLKEEHTEADWDLIRTPPGLGMNMSWLAMKAAPLINAHLVGANLYHANLEHAKLMHANLQFASLQFANLKYANLRAANLQQAILCQSVLQYATLNNANLQYANLRGANLCCANVRSADLRGALMGCYIEEKDIYFNANSTTVHAFCIRGADFEGADLRNTQWFSNEALPLSDDKTLLYFTNYFHKLSYELKQNEKHKRMLLHVIVEDLVRYVQCQANKGLAIAILQLALDIFSSLLKDLHTVSHPVRTQGLFASRPGPAKGVPDTRSVIIHEMARLIDVQAGRSSYVTRSRPGN